MPGEFLAVARSDRVHLLSVRFQQPDHCLADCKCGLAFNLLNQCEARLAINDAYNGLTMTLSNDGICFPVTYPTACLDDGGQFSLGLLIKGAIFRRTFRPVVTMRLCQSIATSSALVQLTLPIFKDLHCIATHSATIDLSWRTKAGGGGIALTHGFGLVVNFFAQISSNVTLFHGVTLGRRDRVSHEGERLTEYPILEDDVWVGLHATIVGRVIISRGSRIAGGTFVTRNIPPYSIVSGNPASIIKSNCVPDVSNPAPV